MTFWMTPTFTYPKSGKTMEPEKKKISEFQALGME